MKIRTGHTFTVKEAKNLQSDGNEVIYFQFRIYNLKSFCMQTSSSESAEASVYGTVSARRSTILSCPISQYSRTPRLAGPREMLEVLKLALNYPLTELSPH